MPLLPDTALVHATLRAIILDALQLDKDALPEDRPFYQVATSSLALVDAFQRVGETFGVRPSLRQVFDRYNTLQSLGDYVVELIREKHATQQIEAPAGIHSGEGYRRIPLTAAQSQLVFLSALLPEVASAWQERLAVSLHGYLPEARLQAAFAALVMRHEALRARLARGDEALVVADRVQARLEVIDLQTEADPKAALQHRLQRSSAEALDVHGALFHGQFLRMGPELSVLVLSGSALVVDRPSLHRLLSDLSALVAVEMGLGKEPPPMVGHLSSALTMDLDTHRQWWADLFADGISQTDLPADHARPAQKTYQGARLVVPLSPCSTPDRWTQFLALVSALLSRWTGQAEVLLGSFVTDWMAAHVCAPRTNPVPLKITVDHELPFSAHLARVRGILLDAIDHASLPFATLVETLNPPRDQGRSPLFTVALDREVWEKPGGGLAWRPLTLPSSRVRYDLHLTLVEGPELLQIQCDYSTDLFSSERVKEWLNTLRLAWDQLQEAQPLYALPACTETERKALLHLEQGLYTPPLACVSLIDLLRQQTLATPLATALIVGEQRLSYAQLLARAEAVARQLKALGVGLGGRVGICVRRSAAMLDAVFGTLAAGAAFVPLDPEYPAARIAFIAEDARLSALVTDPITKNHLSKVAEHCPVLVLDGSPISGVSFPAVGSNPGPNDLAYVIYTSGSTGLPKGVAVNHGTVLNLVGWARRVFTAGELSGMLLSTSLSFDLSIFEIFAPLAVGGTLILADNVVALADLPARELVTLVNAVPSAFRASLRRAPLPTSVQVVVLCGEVLPRDLVDEAYAKGANLRRVVNAYGPTEATVYASWAELPPDSKDLRNPPIGHPLDNTTTWIVEAHGQDQGRLSPRGAIGELFLGGVGVAVGYLYRTELNAQAFLHDPFISGVSNGRMYRTGDLVRLGADGQLEYIGRRDQQIKLHGFRMELGEIGCTLRALPGVVEAEVVVYGQGQDAELVAYVVGDGCDPMAIRAALFERLPRYMVPAHVLPLRAMPHLPNGKLDRSALPSPMYQRAVLSIADYAPPRPGMEQVLADIWMELLEIDRVGRGDDFFELGGHSLLLGAMTITIERRVGVRLRLAEMFGAGNLANLAARIEQIRLEQAGNHTLRRILARTGPDVDAHFDMLLGDAQLDPSWQIHGRPGDPARLNNVLITGVTGFVGAQAFHDLLRQTSAQFWCLVRANSPTEGLSRIQKSLEGYGLWDEAFRPRIRPLLGDLGSERLGLETATYQYLAREVDAIIHMAALVNFIYPYEALRRINVEGVRQILGLAFAERPTPLHYVSTAAVWPMGRHRRFDEDTDIDQRIRLNLGYDESKWVAEQLIFEARRRGLSASILRPGEISGHSRSGRIVLDHFMFAILKGSLQLKCVPRIECLLDMAPVDYVASAIAHIVQRPDLHGKTFHLNNPYPGTPEELYTMLRAYGYSFDIVPLEEWLDVVLTTPDLRGNALYPYTAVLGEFQAENLELPIYGTEKVCAALEPQGIRCPPVDEMLLRTYIDWFLKVGFLPPPTGGGI